MRFDRKTFLDRIRPTIAVKGVGVTEYQVEGLNQLLDFIEADQRWDRFDPDVAVRIIAYFLATVAHECTIKMKIGGRNLYVMSFHPVEEMGGNAYLNRMYDTRTDLGNTAARDGDGARNAGDGYVQNTGGTNARTTGRRLAGTEIRFADVQTAPGDVVAAFTRLGGSQRTPLVVDATTFIREHELLRVPKISYLDAVDGMLTGRYTGKKITDYIDEDENDTYNARRVINGITTKNKPKVLEIQSMSAKFTAALRSARMENSVGFAEAPAPNEVQEAIPAGNDNQPDASEAEIPNPHPNAPEQPQPADFTAYIPNMDSAKSWFRRAVTMVLGGNVAGYYFNLPPEIRYALLALTFLIIGGFIFLLVKFHKEVFDLVAKLNVVRAQPETANFAIVSHKSEEKPSIAAALVGLTSRK